MNKSATLMWNDEDNRDSYKLCLEPYGIKVLLAKDVDEDTVEITVYGEASKVDTFLEAYREDDIELLESMSRSLEFDEDYEGWLNNEIYWFDKLAEMDVFESANVIEIDHTEI